MLKQYALFLHCLQSAATLMWMILTFIIDCRLRGSSTASKAICAYIILKEDKS
jgi:hypothetical protein